MFLSEPDTDTINIPTAHAIQDVVNERHRQVTDEGWSPDHDDTHANGEMASAAACYLIPKIKGMQWPWKALWWKPSTPRRNLIKAAALIIAEIERLDRAEETLQP